MELWELQAREAIRDLVASYAQHADRGRFAELAALFTENGLLEIEGGESMCGRDAIRLFLDRTKDSLAVASSPALVRHHTSSLRIEVDGPNGARGACYFLVLTERGLDHWGLYRDVYVRVGERWRFGSRRVRVEGRAAGSRAEDESRGGRN